MNATSMSEVPVLSAIWKRIESLVYQLVDMYY